MKALIIVDLEGATGIDETRRQWIRCNTPDWQNYGRKAITDDLQVVVQECLRAGVEEIGISDIHDIGVSVIKEQILFPKVKWMHGLWELVIPEGYYDIGLLVGFHPKRQWAGILPHTFRPDIVDFQINGRSIGEIGFYMGILSAKGVPTIFVSGDEHAVLEAQQLVPDIVGAAVKCRCNGNVTLRNRNEADQIIRAHMREALARWDMIPRVQLPWPWEVRIVPISPEYVAGWANSEMVTIQGSDLCWYAHSVEGCLKQFQSICLVFNEVWGQVVSVNQTFLLKMERQFPLLRERMGEANVELEKQGIRKPWIYFSEDERNQLEQVLQRLYFRKEVKRNESQIIK